MTTKSPKEAPIPQTYDERILVKLLEGGQVRPEFVRELLKQELIKNIGETREEVVSVVAELERALSKRVSFAEAVEILEGKLDLEAARTNAVKAHGRWGLVDGLIRAGVIETADQYGALFDKVTISETELKKVGEALERGEKWLPIFDAGEMTPEELFNILFTKDGVPPFTKVDGSRRNMAELRRIKAKDIPDLQNLHENFDYNQLSAFHDAYNRAAPLEPTGPRVIFTPDELQVTRVNHSIIQNIKDSAAGLVTFLDPNADFIRYRSQVDEGLCKIVGGRENFDSLSNEAYRDALSTAFANRSIDKFMPDHANVTRYPNYAFECGRILALQLHTNANEGSTVLVSKSASFSNIEENLGSRIALG